MNNKMIQKQQNFPLISSKYAPLIIHPGFVKDTDFLPLLIFLD
jgi:hypothetical protein